MSGIATPSGISACERLDKENNIKALSTLFVLSASGLQLLPTSIISLRTEFLSVNPTDVILPTILSTLVSAIIGIILVKILIRK
jgi:spore maturation protein A